MTDSKYYASIYCIVNKNKQSHSSEPFPQRRNSSERRKHDRRVKEFGRFAVGMFRDMDLHPDTTEILGKHPEDAVKLSSVRLDNVVVGEELKVTKADLKETRQELNHTREELSGAKAELADTREDLNRVNEELAAAREVAAQQQTQIEESNQEIIRQQKILSDLKGNIEKMQHDPDTKLKNKVGFFSAIEELDVFEKQTYAFVIDARSLKRINDSVSYEAGTEMIVGLADVIRKFFPDAIIVSRYGGDEFYVLVEASPVEAQTRLGELRQLLSGDEGAAEWPITQKDGSKKILYLSARVACAKMNGETRGDMMEAFAEANAQFEGMKEIEDLQGIGRGSAKTVKYKED